MKSCKSSSKPKSYKNGGLVTGGVYTKEMGPPPVDIDQLSALPAAKRAAGEKKAAAQTRKDYPKSTKPMKK